MPYHASGNLDAPTLEVHDSIAWSQPPRHPTSVIYGLLLKGKLQLQLQY